MGTEAPRFRLVSVAIVIARGEVLRRVARAGAVGALVMAIAVGIVSEAFTRSHFPFAWTSIACLCVSAIGGLLMLFAGAAGGRARPGAVELTPDTIEVHHGDIVKRYRVPDFEQGAFSAPDGLTLRLRSGLEIRAHAERDEAEALLELAGLSADQRVLRVPLASAASQMAGGEVLGVLGMILVGPLTLVAAMEAGSFPIFVAKARHFPPPGWEMRHSAFVALVMLVALLGSVAVRALAGFLGRREAVVGLDGVAIEARGRRIFVPLAAIARVIRTARGVALRLQDGSTCDLPVQARILPPLPSRGEPPPSETTAQDALHRRELLYCRIDAAVATRAGGASAALLDVLDRKRRPLNVWRDDLRAQLDRTITYRGPHLTEDQLRDILADGHALPERRVAAAIALSATNDEEHRRRIRGAAEACADDDLRVAIEHAAEGEIYEPALNNIRRRRAT